MQSLVRYQSTFLVNWVRVAYLVACWQFSIFEGHFSFLMALFSKTESRDFVHYKPLPS